MGTLMSSNTELILLMTNPNNIDVADVIGTNANRMGVVDGQFSYATAIGFFSSVINFVLLTIANAIVNKKTGEGLW